MEDEIFVERLIEELARLKEPKNMVAEKIGYSAQTFSNITNGRNRPSVVLLYLLKQEYPDFDVNFLFTGVRASSDTVEVTQLRSELDRRDAIINKLVGKAKGGTKHPKDSVLRMIDRQEARRSSRVEPVFGFRRSVGK